MITQNEFNNRFDDLKEYLGERFDKVEDLLKDHETRLRALEPTGQSSSKMAKAGWVTGVGGIIYAVGQYIWTSLTTKGDVK
jgi:hypothetical protein